MDFVWLIYNCRNTLLILGGTCVCSGKAASILHRLDSTRCGKHSFQKPVHADMIVWCILCSCESPILPHPEEVLLDSDPAKWLGRLTGEHGTHRHVHKTSVRQLWRCDMLHCHTGSGHDWTNTVSYNTQEECGVQVIIDLLKVWCVEHSEMLFCLLQLYLRLTWPFCLFKLVWPFSVVLSHQQGTAIGKTTSSRMFSFFFAPF